ncbi:hypothetical protein [uncultured Flavobacterium sp.]|uniref:hypothetical protein n=1 Tax=uncultured Flavobacterium sp. TaxID=165435 RepID=UPI0025EC4FBA|nr:hypothetical protein [uncultured Flavobacterium sp.]
MCLESYFDLIIAIGLFVLIVLIVGVVISYRGYKEAKRFRENFRYKNRGGKWDS